MDVVTGGVAASQCQNRCHESTGPQKTILLSRWVTSRHWCPRQFQVRSLCYIHNHLGTLAKLQNTHLLSLGILSLLCAFVVKLFRNVTSRSIYNVEKGAQIELLLCFWLLWGEACVAILLRNWVENSNIYMCVATIWYCVLHQRRHICGLPLPDVKVPSVSEKKLPMLYAKAIKKDIK